MSLRIFDHYFRKHYKAWSDAEVRSELVRLARSAYLVACISYMSSLLGLALAVSGSDSLHVQVGAMLLLVVGLSQLRYLALLLLLDEKLRREQPSNGT